MNKPSGYTFSTFTPGGGGAPWVAISS